MPYPKPIHGTGIFTYMKTIKNQPNVGKYTNPMGSVMGYTKNHRNPMASHPPSVAPSVAAVPMPDVDAPALPWWRLRNGGERRNGAKTAMGFLRFDEMKRWENGGFLIMVP